MHRVKVNSTLEAIAPKIISEFTRYQVERSAATHARRTEAATHREPGGAGAPIPRSITSSKPSGDGSKTYEEWERELDATFV
jgi:hypothetical protein